MWRRAIATGLLLAAAASPVATTNEIFVLSAIPGQASYLYQTVRIDAPLMLAPDSSGVLHLGLPSVLGQPGIIAITSPGYVTQVDVNSALLAYRTTPPAGPGPCVATLSPDQTEGTGAWAADATAFYLCIPNAAGTGFIWARAPLVTTW